MKPLRVTDPDTSKLPPILTRAERAQQATAKAVAEAKEAQERGLTAIREALARKTSQ